MENRYYLIDDIPKLSTWFDLIYFNFQEDTAQLTENEIVSLTRLKKHNETSIGNCTIRRVI